MHSLHPLLLVDSPLVIFPLCDDTLVYFHNSASPLNTKRTAIPGIPWRTFGVKMTPERFSRDFHNEYFWDGFFNV